MPPPTGSESIPILLGGLGEGTQVDPLVEGWEGKDEPVPD